MAKMHRITFETPVDILVDIVKAGEPFVNSSGSFRGRPVSKLESMQIMKVTASDYLTIDSRFALMMDEPDYVISYMEIPVGWHSTVRGIDSKAVPPNPERWEWVTGQLLTVKDRSHQRPIDITASIILTLNRELDNVIHRSR